MVSRRNLRSHQPPSVSQSPFPSARSVTHRVSDTGARTDLQAISTTTNLLSLPDEILSEIILHTDKSTALALALVSSRFPSLIDPAIWQHLHLCVPERDTSKAAPTSKRAIAAAQKEEEAIPRRFEAKVQAVLSRANTERAGMVQSVSVSLQPGAIDDLLEVLGKVSPRLQSLTVKAPIRYGARSLARDTFDRGVLSASLSFPALRHLKIECFSFRFEKLINYLTGPAPELQTLDIDVCQGLGYHRGEFEAYPNYPNPSPHSTLRTLRLFRSNDTAYDGATLIRMFRPLVCAPNVRQTILQYDVPSPPRSPPVFNNKDDDKVEDVGFICEWDPCGERLLGVVPDQVEDLAAVWEVDPGVFAGRIGSDKARFQKLRRLIVGWPNLEKSLNYLPKLPSLEVIALSGPHHEASTEPDHTVRSMTLRARKMSSTFASNLRGSPRLRIIHQFDNDTDFGGIDIFDRLDEVESKGTARGYITSVRHGEDELLHARIMLDASKGWTEMTDYKGRTVPLDVVEAVRLKAGMEAADWKGRGLAVGDEAWGLLQKWYKKK